MGQPKVAFATLGCKVNQYESEAIKSLFLEQGYQIVDFADPADVYVINTCTVTHLGNRKSRQMIRRATNTSPEAVVAVTGCYAQTAPGEVLAIPVVNLVIGTCDRGQIVDLVEKAKAGQAPINAVRNIMEAEDFEEISVLKSEQRTRAFVKIQEGCNNFCSYCIIPFARGPLRSRQPERVVAEVERLVRAGFKEIVLTGICIGAYGRDLLEKNTEADALLPTWEEELTLAGLVRSLVQIPDLVRLRLGSVEPTDITPDLVAVLADYPQVCKHLHIPLQSGSDITLKAMNRRYNTMEYAKLLGYLRYMIPDLAITTDVIAGFPGEEEEAHFLHTLEFVEKMEFAALHVFKYSPRKGTTAAEQPDSVPAEVKEHRSNRLIELGNQAARDFACKFLGQTLEVIVEQKANKVTTTELTEVTTSVYPGVADLDQPDVATPGQSDNQNIYEGLAGNYLRILFPAEQPERGQLVKVLLKNYYQDALWGEIV